MILIDNYLKDFYATEASFRFIMMAYNIMALFKTRSAQFKYDVSTKILLLCIGSWKHANIKTLKISLPQKDELGWMVCLKICETIPTAIQIYLTILN